MNQKEYKNAYRYASKFTKDYFDVVHDAYLYYKLLTNKELFDEPNSVVIREVKRQYNRSVGGNKHRYQWRLERVPTKHYSFDATDNDQVVENRFGIYTEDFLSTIHVDYEIARLSKKLTEKQIYLLNMSYQGYTSTDLAEMQQINRSSISKSLRLVRNKAANILINS